MKTSFKIKTVSYALVALSLLNASCRSLTSTTYIKANDSFLLGDNAHGQFKVKIKNASPHSIEVYRKPIAGGQHSFVTVKPLQTVKVNVEENTALVVSNKSNDKATVQLVVTGEPGGNLSMGYKNKN
jgi:hypothetical protein